MGKTYPLLDRDQIEQVLSRLGFTPKRQQGSHVQWEGYANKQRRIITVDHLKSKKEKYTHRLIYKMIQQSGLTKKEFYSHLTVK